MFYDIALAVRSCLGRLCTFFCRNTHVPQPPCPAPIPTLPSIPALHSLPTPAQRSCTCNRIFPSVPFFSRYTVIYRIFHSLDGTREKFDTKEKTHVLHRNDLASRFTPGSAAQNVVPWLERGSSQRMQLCKCKHCKRAKMVE